ncbi:MAG TPA: hypothetical protein VNO30_13590, partial [Kofleriaceae bacterium]|nr:hypothetical protein [Kofleriaceae bacterium]
MTANVGIATANVAAATANVGVVIGNVGAAISDIGAAIGNIGAAIGNIGAAISNGGATISRCLKRYCLAGRKLRVVIWYVVHMRRDWRTERGHGHDSNTVQRSASPGKQTLTSLLRPTGPVGKSVQPTRLHDHEAGSRVGANSATTDPFGFYFETGAAVQSSSDVSGQSDVLAAARSGSFQGDLEVAAEQRDVSGHASILPHDDAIRRSFGWHDISGISADIGGTAAEAASSMNVVADAIDDGVEPQQEPELHAAAHDVRHRMGVTEVEVSAHTDATHAGHAKGVPNAERRDEAKKQSLEELKSRVDNTHDPERKLKLWGEYHKLHVENDAKTTADVRWSPIESNEQQRKNLYKNKVRNETVSDTKDEVDDEIAFLEKQKAGTLTEADIKELERRKEHEHQIELKYNVNLTNKEDKNTDGQKLAWTDSGLDEIESALAHMPKEHINGNMEINRDIADKERPLAGGKYRDGVITIYNPGVTGPYGHTGDLHELADPKLKDVNGQQLSKTGDEIKPLEQVLNHEFGHAVHDQNSEVFRRYQAAAGWQSDVSEKQMRKAGIPAAAIEVLKKDKDKDKDKDK